MKLRKATVLLTSLAIIFSIFAGKTGPAKKTEAAVSGTLPEVTGLYIAEWQDWMMRQEK